MHLGKQTEYWDKVANEKTFSHPIQFDFLDRVIKKDAKILDYGCGYGRVCHKFLNASYTNIIGVDISKKMIERGLNINPDMNLLHFDGDTIPQDDESVDLCTLMAVLTCIPTDETQISILDEIYRVLKPGGILYISDIYLQDTERNIKRYEKYHKSFNNYGVFELPDGGIVRHHTKEWIESITSRFLRLDEKLIKTVTMNGNSTEIFQLIVQK